MAYEWQTVEQAAVTLGISARTLARRIAKNDLENRLQNGRREVFICLPDEPEPEMVTPVVEERATIIDSTGTAMGAVNANAAASQTVAYDPNVTQALVVAEDRARRAEMAILVIQQSTKLVQHEVARARTGARWAWSTVALLAVGAMVAVAWTTANVTRSQARIEHLQERALSATESAEKQSRENASLREKNDQALQAVAKATGELEEVHREITQARTDISQTRVELQQVRDRKPATQPSTLVKRIATAVLGD